MTKDKALDLALEALESCGAGQRIVGIVFTPTSPASGWIAIYQKEKT
jgi:hypothetical protein